MGLKILCLLLLLFLCAACGEINLIASQEAFKKVNLSIKEHCPEPGNSILTPFASNLSLVNKGTYFEIDTDRDFLSDLDELAIKNSEISLDPKSKTSYQNNYSDFFLYHFIEGGADTVNGLRTCNIFQDSDSDLISDCEEEVLGTDPFNPDSDGDGIIDGLEYKNHLNALDSSDATLNATSDGIINLEKIYANINLNVQVNEFQKENATDYLVKKFTNYSGKECYEVKAKNIPIVDVSNGNFIKFMIIERNQSDVVQIQYIDVIASKLINNNRTIVIDSLEGQEIFIDPKEQVEP